jgi:hypothetical protein
VLDIMAACPTLRFFGVSMQIHLTATPPADIRLHARVVNQGAVLSGLDPALVRSKVFAYAQQIGPLAVDPAPSPHNPFERPTALDVYAHVATELGCAPDDLERALYADLRDHHHLIAAPVPEPTALLHRYHVALVQGILLRATEVRLTLAAPTVPRVRQLLRYAKFHQLMVRATRDDGDLHLVLDVGRHLHVERDGQAVRFADDMHDAQRHRGRSDGRHEDCRVGALDRFVEHEADLLLRDRLGGRQSW